MTAQTLDDMLSLSAGAGILVFILLNMWVSIHRRSNRRRARQLLTVDCTGLIFSLINLSTRFVDKINGVRIIADFAMLLCLVFALTMAARLRHRKEGV